MKFTEKPGVYCIYCISNGKRYIGSTLRVSKRIQNHRYNLRKGRARFCPSLLYKDWLEYGEENFIFSALDYCEESQLLEKEKYWMDFFESTLLEKGYNIADAITHKYAKGVNSNKVAKYKRVSKDNPVLVLFKDGSIKEYISPASIISDPNIEMGSKIYEYLSYWKNLRGRRKIFRDMIFVYKDMYNPDFDYFHFIPVRVRTAPLKEKKKKKEIKPHSERNLKRVCVIAENVQTGEVLEFPMITTAIKELNLSPAKVHKCLKSPFRKYQHRGYFLRYKEQG